MTATDKCESCGVALALIPGAWIEVWDLDVRNAPISLPVHTPDRCHLLRRIADMNRSYREEGRL